MKRLLLLLLLLPAPAWADHPGLETGMVELGLAGSLSAVEGDVRADLGLRSGGFLGAGPGFVSGEIELGWRHVAGLDALEGGVALGWSQPLGHPALLAHALGGFWVRSETIGSFRQLRLPAGGVLGLRYLPAEAVSLRLDYRPRRVLRDPVQDYTEHALRLGLSVLF